MGPWKQDSEDSPSLTGFHGFSSQTPQYLTGWQQSMESVPSSGASYVRVEDKWDPSLQSPSQTILHGSQDSGAPHHVMLAGHDAHHASFDLRSSMRPSIRPGIYAPIIVPSSTASPVETHHTQMGTGPAPRHQGMTDPTYPWLGQQRYSCVRTPASEYGQTWFANYNNKNNTPYPQQEEELMEPTLPQNQ
ncbi:uncharacterized protein B0I36DRAFT_320707 [Microdochium trichocladiopsis]|uniref:Uncharacterized protein n=1 Tax=Microdochium trichocladiopsis TaxID=1682393 RepID=A0A9P8YBC3_9PEZI|nr:uncharacterized protein B0I36DRAFT_320707 [Microdochium trichocladiopsis]KAH7033067.1 hypothetical protein B0I36DRAFT_320707 [Microdochium trichocladiopsis]